MSGGGGVHGRVKKKYQQLDVGTLLLLARRRRRSSRNF
jgi:hypothetical protein